MVLCVLEGGRLQLEPKTQTIGAVLLILSTGLWVVCVVYMLLLDSSVYIANKSILVHSKDKAMSAFDKGTQPEHHLQFCVFFRVDNCSIA